MAKFTWTAASETLGAQPALLENVCAGALSDWEIVSAASSYGGKALKRTATATANARRRLAVPSAGTTGRVDIRGFYYKATSTTSGMHIFIRNAGTSEADGTDYYVTYDSAEKLELASYQPAYTSLVKVSGNPVPAGWWNVRYTYDPLGTPIHTYKLWANGDVEANAYVLTSDAASGAITGGRFGIGTGSSNEQEGMFSWFTVGTDGDNADVSPDAAGSGSGAGAPATVTIAAPSGTASGSGSAPAVKGAAVTLHNGSTPQASLTGITARWWDGPTAEGAPLLKTDAASTDATGLLELDIDAVTALAVGGVGYLSLYKAGADAESDLHFASRITVSDIA